MLIQLLVDLEILTNQQAKNLAFALHLNLKMKGIPRQDRLLIAVMCIYFVPLAAAQTLNNQDFYRYRLQYAIRRPNLSTTALFM